MFAGLLLGAVLFAVSAILAEQHALYLPAFVLVVAAAMDLIL